MDWTRDIKRVADNSIGDVVNFFDHDLKDFFENEIGAFVKTAEDTRTFVKDKINFLKRNWYLLLAIFVIAFIVPGLFLGFFSRLALITLLLAFVK